MNRNNAMIDSVSSSRDNVSTSIVKNVESFNFDQEDIVSTRGLVYRTEPKRIFRK